MAGSHLRRRLIPRRQTQSSDGCCMQNLPAELHHEILPLPGLGFEGNETWAVTPALAHTLPCAAGKRCQGGLGKQGSVQTRKRLTSSTDWSRSKPRAKAPARGQRREQPACCARRCAAKPLRGELASGGTSPAVEMTPATRPSASRVSGSYHRQQGAAAAGAGAGHGRIAGRGREPPKQPIFGSSKPN